jgi:hypothetical protein
MYCVLRGLGAIVFLAAGFAISQPAGAQTPVFRGPHVRVLKTAAGLRPWLNPALSPDTRANLVVQLLTLDEALQLVEGLATVP